MKDPRSHFELCLEPESFSIKVLEDLIFQRTAAPKIIFKPELKQRVEDSRKHLVALLQNRTPIYGVSTGFGDSCHRFIPPDHAKELQVNLTQYLNCGTGETLPVEVSRAVMWIHLKALSRGYSGVSMELLEQLVLFIERDWVPEIPAEGSLGASGDLVPLSYLARALIGQGEVFHGPDQRVQIASELEEFKPYELKAKEGLSLVNGTTVMSAMALYNLSLAKFLLELAQLSAAWQCMVLGGKTESFDRVVNGEAKVHPSQAQVGAKILNYLREESYQSGSVRNLRVKDNLTEGLVQDKYSLRCVPQVLGPIFSTFSQIEQWVDDEINSCSDNPLIDDEGHLHSGGNFYGGYLSHGMDYLKICLANLADLMDRQVLMIVDDKSNRGLPPNLAAWNHIPPERRHLHHGLKGLHQSMSAITSEVIQKSFPGSVLSRSAESHNQDKVSLGMSAAMQAKEMLEKMFTLQTLQLTCLAQALDLKEIGLRGEISSRIYHLVRSEVPFVDHDQSLGKNIAKLRTKIFELAKREGSKVFYDHKQI